MAGARENAARRRRLGTIGFAALPVIALLLLPIATNVATGSLPEAWRPWLWLAWPVAVVLAVPIVVMEIRRLRHAGPAAGGLTMAVDGLTVRSGRRPGGLTYRANHDRGRLVLRASDPYLDHVRAGGKLEPGGFLGDHTRPVLDVKVVNNTPRTVVFHEAVFVVTASRIDLRPVHVVSRGEDMSFYLGNYGWGPLVGASLDFDLVAAPHEPGIGRFHLDLDGEEFGRRHAHEGPPWLRLP